MDRELIEKFIEVTGESEETAVQYLTIADGNVEQAITLMFESGPVPAQRIAPDDEPEVRPPISPTQEVLVPDDSIYALPRASKSVFDRFRDFSVEIRRQEEEMTRQVSGEKIPSHCKTKRLEDLFRPPYDILFLGTFVEAREYAKSKNRWLLVNVQNPQEFACQMLNRDVWSDKQIKEIIKDHFVLWQVLSDTADGRRYIDFYNVLDYPYLAVVDPRTGECMRSYNTISMDHLLTGLNDVLSSQPSPDCSSDSPDVEASHCEPTSSAKRGGHFNNSKDSGRRIKKSRVSIDPTTSVGFKSLNGEPSVSTSTGSSAVIRGKRSRMEIDNADGDPADEAAMPTKEDSVAKTSNSTPTVSNDKSKPSTSSYNSKPSTSTYNSKPSTSSYNNTPSTSTNNSIRSTSSKNEIANGELSLRLCLRLPGGEPETISMRATDTIECFIKRIEDMGYSRTEHTYLIPFPKTNVGALPTDSQLRDTVLYPSSTVFITKV
ncbi:UBX domain-containing protein 7 isoform X1 [Microplitis mediator]|uniref:UBX domain-containing protein 7 isoform X1 n=1 Tax=Microplitis mediator TaxID=375433 RepID=UPI002557482A|nr:UBX domain-containing protein 7 isoform X1 [Microplitis mediator]